MSSQICNFSRVEVRQQLVVFPHQFVGDRHHLAKHLARRLIDTDVVIERFGHLVDAVESLKQWCRDDDLGFLAEFTLKIAANILYNVLKTTTSGGVTVGPVLMGVARTAHILTPAATVRRVLNMTALAAASNA